MMSCIISSRTDEGMDSAGEIGLGQLSSKREEHDYARRAFGKMSSSSCSTVA
jgi:hypothetical protein